MWSVEELVYQTPSTAKSARYKRKTEVSFQMEYAHKAERNADGCPKIVNLGSSKTDLFYERKKYGFKKR